MPNHLALLQQSITAWDTWREGHPVEDLGYQIINAIPHLEYHRCFIAYAGVDVDFARRLHAGLQANGIRCWFAPEDRPIDDAVRLRDKLVLILSKAALNSGYAASEADRALSRARTDERTVLAPVRLDDAVFDVDEGWALPLKEDPTLGDFSDPATYDERGFSSPTLRPFSSFTKT